MTARKCSPVSFFYVILLILIVLIVFRHSSLQLCCRPHVYHCPWYQPNTHECIFFFFFCLLLLTVFLSPATSMVSRPFEMHDFFFSFYIYILLTVLLSPPKPSIRSPSPPQWRVLSLSPLHPLLKAPCVRIFYFILSFLLLLTVLLSVTTVTSPTCALGCFMFYFYILINCSITSCQYSCMPNVCFFFFFLLYYSQLFLCLS